VDLVGKTTGLRKAQEPVGEGARGTAAVQEFISRLAAKEKK
jgi:hypothetical protein